MSLSDLVFTLESGKLWFTARSAQREPPRLVLEVGGTSTLQAVLPVKLKSSPLQASKWGGTSALQAWLPAKLKSPPLQAEVWGGSRWTDLAVYFHVLNCERQSLSSVIKYCVAHFNTLKSKHHILTDTYVQIMLVKQYFGHWPISTLFINTI